MIDLPAVRRHFPILSHTTYLNSCSLGALSDRAEGELKDCLDRWHRRGAAAWYEEWMGQLGRLRAGVARLQNAQAREIALLPSTSAALSMIAESVPTNGRNRVVVADLDFPTLPYQWMVKPEIEVVRVRSEDGVGVHPDQFAEVVDDRTLFLATSHVFYSTGYAQDVGRLAQIARDAGAFSLIDGYQAAGQIPIDVAAAGVDFYTSGPLKWLCGGPGLAYLYVRQDRIQELSPRITSWFSARDQFDFDAERFHYHDDARRFEMGTPSMPSVHLALGAHGLLEEIGFDQIYARIAHLTGVLVERLQDAGFTLTIAGPESRSGIVMVRHDDPAGVVRALEAAGFVVDHRPGHVRVSPHFYNSEPELEAFVAALASLTH